MSEYRKDVFLIGGTHAGHSLALERVGGKAFNLVRMAQAGLRVPPALVLGTTFSHVGWGREPGHRDAIRDVLRSNVERLEDVSHLKLGSTRHPLILSVRSGAPVSMPGMMATLLNVGITDRTVHGLIRRTGNPALAWDAYRRLIEGFAELVVQMPPDRFRALVNTALDNRALESVRELDSLAARELVASVREEYDKVVGEPFPQDPLDQLVLAVEAVFASWYSPRARRYRALHEIDERVGTAVIIQQMVFGNAGGTSGSGVGFTRNPASGANELYVDFLPNVQGEDIVSGRHVVHVAEDLERFTPGLHAELLHVRSQLEREFGDLQDFEFTVEDGRLYLLQTRSAHRTPWAALHVAVDLVRDGIIDEPKALELLEPYELESIARNVIVRPDATDLLARGVGASVGVGVGHIVLDTERAVAMVTADQPVILVREDTETEDLDGFVAAAGVLTARGGRTSHAAVVTRQLGKPCVVSCDGLQVDLKRRRCLFSGQPVPEHSVISIDGDTGAVYMGEVRVSTEHPEDALATVRSWERNRPAPAVALSDTGTAG